MRARVYLLALVDAGEVVEGSGIESPSHLQRCDVLAQEYLIDKGD